MISNEHAHNTKVIRLVEASNIPFWIIWRWVICNLKCQNSDLHTIGPRGSVLTETLSQNPDAPSLSEASQYFTQFCLHEIITKATSNGKLFNMKVVCENNFGICSISIQGHMQPPWPKQWIAWKLGSKAQGLVVPVRLYVSFWTGFWTLFFVENSSCLIYRREMMTDCNKAQSTHDEHITSAEEPVNTWGGRWTGPGEKQDNFFFLKIYGCPLEVC